MNRQGDRLDIAYQLTLVYVALPVLKGLAVLGFDFGILLNAARPRVTNINLSIRMQAL